MRATSANYLFQGCHLPVILIGVLVLIAGVFLARPAAANSDLDEAALWDALRTGKAFAIMRHALAPGTGDPANFAVEDCATQRNLNDVGRDQARRIGDRFRANGITDANVLSSQWCRCLETAELLGLGTVQAFPTINSFFRDRENRDPQTRALRDYLGTTEMTKPLVLVTHQVNITALLNIFPRSGETLVVRPASDGTMTVLGSLGDSFSE